MRITCLTILIVWCFSSALAATTLRDVLKEHGFESVPLKDLDLAILSWEIADTRDFFCVGYFIRVTDYEIHLVVFDRNKKQWSETEINLRKSDCPPSNAILALQFTKKFLHMETHVNPSANCTFIFSKALQLRKVLYGWPLAVFDDETIVYHHSEVHFAPTHPAAISLYNPLTKHDRNIYPQKPYERVRQMHIAKMKEIYSDEKWCMEKNHHCDPESFNDSIGDLEINNKTDSLIFQARFSGDYGKEGNGPEVQSLDVMYIYQNVRDPERMKYREFLETEFKNRFGDRALSEYLEPAILSQIFGS